MTRTQTTIPYGPDHATELLALLGMSRESWQMKKPFAWFREHGTDWKFYSLPDGRTIGTRTDKYTSHTLVTVYADKQDARNHLHYIKFGSGDIENGGAPFGYQRSPSAAKARLEAEFAMYIYEKPIGPNPADGGS